MFVDYEFIKLFLAILFWLAGPLLASFFTLTIQRQISESEFEKIPNASHCPNCQHKLSWWQLIPVISYIGLRGKCHFCKAEIGVRVFYAELLGLIATIPIALLIHEGKGLTTITLISVFTVTLLYLAIYDLFTLSIPESITYALVGFSLTAFIIRQALELVGGDFALQIRTAWGDTFSLQGLMLAISVMVFTGLIVYLSREQAMGTGDIYLLGAIALMLGWPMGAVAFYITLIVGGFLGISYAAYRRQFKGLIIPLIPLLLIGFSLSFIFTGPLISLLFW